MWLGWCNKLDKDHILVLRSSCGSSYYPYYSIHCIPLITLGKQTIITAFKHK